MNVTHASISKYVFDTGIQTETSQETTRRYLHDVTSQLHLTPDTPLKSNGILPPNKVQNLKAFVVLLRDVF